MATRDELAAVDAVGSGCECPTCGNAEMDTLCLDDDDVVECGECGSFYTLGNGGGSSAVTEPVGPDAVGFGNTSTD
jgi:hypothetical protein